MSLAATFKEVIGVITGRTFDYDRWCEAQAAETRAILRTMGIRKLITANDIKNQMRWSAQARREQLDLAWISQAKREQLNISAITQEESDDAK